MGLFAQALEPYRLFFLEDSLPPEQADHFRIIRQHSSVPIAMGELFVSRHAHPHHNVISGDASPDAPPGMPDGCLSFQTNVQEYLPLIKDRLIDFIRVHMSDIGGLTPMIKLAALCQFFGVRVALHGEKSAHFIEKH